MSEQLTDQVLVERVQKGDQKAFNLLVVRYQHKVASLVSRYVPSGDVPDVVQEAFIKAYRALDSFRGDSAFYTWLYRIAVNTAKNYLVAQGRRPPSSDVDAIEAENFPREGEDLKQHVEQHSDSIGASLVTQMVKNLPAMQETGVFIPRSERSPGEGNGYPIQCSCLENPMSRRAWQAAVHRVEKSWAQLSG